MAYSRKDFLENAPTSGVGRLASANRDLHRVRMLGRLGELTDAAIDAIASCLTDDNPSVRLAAAKEVLDRQFGKPKTEAHVITATFDASAAHLAALEALTAKAIANDAPVMIDATPDAVTVDAVPNERGEG